MKTLEQMQDYMDAVETIESYKNELGVRVWLFIGKCIGGLISNLFVGFILFSGAKLAEHFFGKLI